MIQDNADLTRWNRAGLAKFRYISGNAATYLDLLREGLESGFPDWKPSPFSEAVDESEKDRLERLIDQYLAARGDLTWEISRSFARCAHVLCEHLDAYANEGYLRTATQWDNVRRLVAMLDYHPAPPASAATWQVLKVKDGLSGTVEAGFQLKYSPPDGDPPVIFETLEDLDVDAALNSVRLSGWNRATGNLSGATWLIGEDADVTAGQTGLIVAGKNARVVTVTAISEPDSETGLVELTLDENVPTSWKKADAILLLSPKSVRRPRLNGTGVVQLIKPSGIVSGEMVAWKDRDDKWIFAKVSEADSMEIAFEGSQPESGDVLYRMVPVEEKDSSTNKFAFPGSFRMAARESGGSVEMIGTDAMDPVKDDDEVLRYYTLKNNSGISRVYHVPTEAEPAGSVAAGAEEYEFDGDPGDLKSGQWIVATLGSEDLPGKIIRITEQEDSFILKIELQEKKEKRAPSGSIREEVVRPERMSRNARLVRISGPFELEARPEGYDRNETGVSGSLLHLDGGLPAGLVRGKALILEQENGERDGFQNPLKVTVKSLNQDAGTIVIDPAIASADGFTRGNLVVRGNVAHAGHGESKPAKVLGSGDASQSHQVFQLKVDGISFVQDTTMPSGYRADIDVQAGARTWTQVATLNDSGPADPHFTVRLDEDGFIRIQFGDGINGRRLPTGSSNVKVTYRKGNGLSGNLPPDSLAKAVKPHYLIDSVRQPLPSAGGNDLEDVDSLRENAPAAVLTLGRAVSLRDYARLAGSQSSVWQAVAIERPGRRRGRGRVEIVVVPAGGGGIENLKESLTSTIQAHALPTVDVEVLAYEPYPFNVAVELRIQSDAFVPEEVVSAAATALGDTFSLQNRKLGQDLFLSEIYRVVEAVTGVENSICILNADSSVQRLESGERGVVYLDPDLSVIDIEWKEYAP